jgi:hypothetical protein
MIRAGVSLIVVLAAALTTGCGGDEGGGASPTGPSSTTSTTVSSQPQPQPSCTLTAPGNLTVASVQGTVVTLTWSAVSGATEYLILVGSGPSSSNDLSTNTTQTNYTWTEKNGKHYARVQARFACGYSGSSNEVEFTVG